jgi:peptidyl-tRNA hydrolase, PTH1 family
MVKALVGLGNNGEQYQKTYHNVGSFVAQQIQVHAAQEDQHLRRYELTGFMNVSGPAVLRWMKLNNLNVHDIVVIHDESDLPVGEYKLSYGGGSAGHKGILSLIDALGTADFWRLRIGVRNPEEKNRTKAGDFVLNQWRSSDEKIFLSIAEQAWLELRGR